MAVIQIMPHILNLNVPHTDKLVTNVTEVVSYKFYVPDNIAVVTWRIKIVKPCHTCPDIGFHVQANGMPSTKSFLQSTILAANQSTDQSIEFYPQENAWHYVDMFLLFEGMNSSAPSSPPPPPTDTDTVEFELQFSYTVDAVPAAAPDAHHQQHLQQNQAPSTIERQGRNFTQYPLLRQTYREFFMFDYDLLPDENGTVPASLNLTSAVPVAMRFDVGDVYDIGGTLSFAIAMRQDMKGNHIDAPKINDAAGNVVAEKLVGSTEMGEFNETKVDLRSNQTIIVCMRLEEPGIPKWPDECVYGRQVFPAASIINNTNVDTGTGTKLTHFIH